MADQDPGRRLPERAGGGDVVERADLEGLRPHDPRDPEATLAQANERQVLEEALRRVPVKYREILVLKDVEELSYEEIRAILGLPITTLKIRVVRARAMMRTYLEGKRTEKAEKS